MSRKIAKIMGAVGVALGLLIALTPFQLAPVCQKLLELNTGKMVHMRCHYTGQAEVFLGVTIAIISLMYLFSKSSNVQKYLGAVLAVLGIVVILLPTNFGIGVCMSPMECHTTAKVLYVLGGLLVIDGLMAFFQKETPLEASEDLKA